MLVGDEEVENGEGEGEGEGESEGTEKSTNEEEEEADVDVEECSSVEDGPLHRMLADEMGGTGASSRKCADDVSVTEDTKVRLKTSCNSDELRDVECHLETKDLWKKFNSLGTEMIITKTGR
ncbi:T-box protein H15 [Harpegnathos saltator]|uniref:T-box protein H15 n=2 Tax=Harpegnathos saltator TaxID=610380 RepID=E2BYC0_HARSA|nr:T-box protein H15 [Harpegnathos saltator]